MNGIRTTGITRAVRRWELLAGSGAIDVLDALVALVAVPGDQLLTSDPTDLRVLVAQRGIPVTVVRV